MDKFIKDLSDRLVRRETWAYVTGIVIASLTSTGVLDGQEGVAITAEQIGVIATLLGVGGGGAIIRGQQKGERIFAALRKKSNDAEQEDDSPPPDPRLGA